MPSPLDCRRSALPARGARRGGAARRRGRSAGRVDRAAAARVLLACASARPPSRGWSSRMPPASAPCWRASRSRSATPAASSAPAAPGASRARPPRCCWSPRSPAASCSPATCSSRAPPSTGCCSARCSGSRAPTSRSRRPRRGAGRRPATLALGRGLVGDRLRPRRRAGPRPARRARRLPAAGPRGGRRGGGDPGGRARCWWPPSTCCPAPPRGSSRGRSRAARLVGRAWRSPRACSVSTLAYWLDVPPGPPVAVLGALDLRACSRWRRRAGERRRDRGRAGRGPAAGYGGPPVLTRGRFAAEPGQTVCVLGPNGGGKTTLFRALMGELEPHAGRVAGERAARRTWRRPNARGSTSR